MTATVAASSTGATFEVEVFFDGGCPLCRREIALLQRLDRRRRIRFTDIALPDFDAASLGQTQDDLMREIKGRLPDGTWISGVEVFRRLYAAVGFRWLVPVTRLPGIRQLLHIGYRIFARNRLKLTGRCTEKCRLDSSTHEEMTNVSA
jgi:predicted DCC family thiol-disulfide oxidoreductase YuxK